MRKTMLAAAAMLTVCSAAFAQSTVVITDPAATGSTVVLPGEVRTHVMEQQTPSVVYDGDIAVGATHFPVPSKSIPSLMSKATPIRSLTNGA